MKQLSNEVIIPKTVSFCLSLFSQPWFPWLQLKQVSVQEQI